MNAGEKLTLLLEISTICCSWGGPLALLQGTLCLMCWATEGKNTKQKTPHWLSVIQCLSSASVCFKVIVNKDEVCDDISWTEHVGCLRLRGGDAFLSRPPTLFISSLKIRSSWYIWWLRGSLPDFWLSLCNFSLKASCCESLMRISVLLFSCLFKGSVILLHFTSCWIWSMTFTVRIENHSPSILKTLGVKNHLLWRLNSVLGLPYLQLFLPTAL